MDQNSTRHVWGHGRLDCQSFCEGLGEVTCADYGPLVALGVLTIEITHGIVVIISTTVARVPCFSFDNDQAPRAGNFLVTRTGWPVCMSAFGTCGGYPKYL